MQKISLLRPIIENIFSQNPFPLYNDNLVFEITNINIYPKILMFFLILISGIIGIFFNYYIGYCLYWLFIFKKHKMSIDTLERIRNVKYLIKNYFIAFLGLYIYSIKMGSFVLFFISITGISKNKRFYLISLFFYTLYIIRRVNY